MVVFGFAMLVWARVATKREIGTYKKNRKNIGKIWVVDGFCIFVLYVSYIFTIFFVFPNDFCKANLSLPRANTTLCLSLTDVLCTGEASGLHL